MRSAEQISRTVGEWHDHQRAERERHLRELLAQLRRARETHDPWYTWVAARARGEHVHGIMDEHGATVACPVPGCDHHRGCQNPHRLSGAKRPNQRLRGVPA